MSDNPRKAKRTDQSPSYMRTPLLPRSASLKALGKQPFSAYAFPIIRSLALPGAHIEASPPAAHGAATPALKYRGSHVFDRKMSVPAVSDTHLPKIKRRASCDPDAIVKLSRDILTREVAKPSLKVCIGRCFCVSQVGAVFSHPKPNNQDAHYYLQTNLQGSEIALLGVCDGHGAAGHFVSNFVTKTLPNKIREAYQHTSVNNYDFWSTVMVDSFMRCNNELKCQKFDTVCSGCTNVAVVVIDGQVICANVGDSRAVLARRTASAVIALPLSRDHKPDVPEEKQRIIDFGGRVEPVYGPNREEIGPPRVWLKNEDAPGLAMSRAMGDTLATCVGVIATPGTDYTELFTSVLTPEDAFIIIGSDGIWEFISNQEAVDFVESQVRSGHMEECCQMLVEEATKRWNKEEDCVDDITVVVAFLETR